MNDAHSGRLGRLVQSLVKWRPQLSLSTLLYLVAAAATLVAYRQTNLAVEEQKSRLAVLRPLTQQLVIYDVTKITAVRRLPEFFGECIWDVHIPDGSNLRLMFDAKPIQWLTPGKHVIEYQSNLLVKGLGDSRRHAQSRSLLVDGVILTEDQISWTPFSGDNDGGLYELTTGVPRQPFVLVRRTPPKVAKGSWSDKLLWIE